MNAIKDRSRDNVDSLIEQHRFPRLLHRFRIHRRNMWSHRGEFKPRSLHFCAVVIVGGYRDGSAASAKFNGALLVLLRVKLMAFPAVPGGKGAPEDTLGGMNGWLVTKGAPKEAAEFLRFFLDAQNQKIAAERGWFIPVLKAAADSVKRPMLQDVARNVSRSQYHQIFYDQMLGPSVGAVVNDVSADLAAARTSPADAANKVQQAWQQAN